MIKVNKRMRKKAITCKKLSNKQRLKNQARKIRQLNCEINRLKNTTGILELIAENTTLKVKVESMQKELDFRKQPFWKRWFA